LYEIIGNFLCDNVSLKDGIVIHFLCQKSFFVVIDLMCIAAVQFLKKSLCSTICTTVSHICSSAVTILKSKSKIAFFVSNRPKSKLSSLLSHVAIFCSNQCDSAVTVVSDVVLAE